MNGGQFVYHPRKFTAFKVRPVPEKADHPVLADGGIGPFPVTTEQYYLHVDPAIGVLAVTESGPDPDRPTR